MTPPAAQPPPSMLAPTKTLLTWAILIITHLATTEPPCVLSEVEARCGALSNNVDYPGNDLAAVAALRAEDCCGLCNQSPLCNAFTWSRYNNGVCYLKTVQPLQVKRSQPLANGDPYHRPSVFDKCGAFKVHINFPGSDLHNVRDSNVENCCAYCRTTKNCATFTWTDYYGDTCWLKSSSSTKGAASCRARSTTLN